MGAILRAAMYARYSSENQRKESIEDQLATCPPLPRLARIIRGGLDSDTSGVWKVAGVGLRWT